MSGLLPLSPAECRSLLDEARRSEKEQALSYRSLAAQAEVADDSELAQRFHNLHADEQHHLSRLTARVLELGGLPADLADVVPIQIPLEAWEGAVRAGEQREIERYTKLLEHDVDPQTRHLIGQILAVEAQHAAELGGKWTFA